MLTPQRARIIAGELKTNSRVFMSDVAKSYGIPMGEIFNDYREFITKFKPEYTIIPKVHPMPLFSQNERKVYAVLRRNSRLPIKEVAKKTGLAFSTVFAIMNKLKPLFHFTMSSSPVYPRKIGFRS